MCNDTTSTNRRNLGTMNDPIESTLAATYPGAADLTEGYFLATEFGSLGGAETETVVEPMNDGAMMRKKIRYDSVELKTKVQKLINAGYSLMRKYCAPTFAGLYFVPKADFHKLDGELQEMRDFASTLNDYAREHGFARRTKIEIYPMPMDPSNPRIALRIGKTLYEYLTRLRDSYTAEAQNAFVLEMRVCKNIYKMLSGRQEAIVREALLASDAQRPIMIAMSGGRRGAVQLLKDTGGSIPELDYGPIDRAIALFEPAADSFE